VIFSLGMNDAQKYHEKGVYKLELETWYSFNYPKSYILYLLFYLKFN
jgi:hypothetical protein